MGFNLNEIWSSVKDVTKDRTTSPFFGTFLLVWIVINWKPIYLTLFISSEQIPEWTKIEYIQHFYSNWENLFIIPFVFTIGVLIVYPTLSVLAFQLYLVFDRWKRKVKFHSDQITPLTKEESNKIRSEVYQKEKQLSTMYEDLATEKEQLLSEKIELQKSLNHQINGLRHLIEQKEEELKLSDKQHQTIQERLNSTQANLDTVQVSLNKLEDKWQNALKSIKIFSSVRRILRSEFSLIEWNHFISSYEHPLMQRKWMSIQDFGNYHAIRDWLVQTNILYRDFNNKVIITDKGIEFFDNLRFLNKTGFWIV